MSNHEHFRELSALAAIGQLSRDEDRELSQHLNECADCREIREGYARVVVHQLPQADAIRWRVKSAFSRPSLDPDLRDRFLARGRAEGLEFSSEAVQPRSRHNRSVWKVRYLRPALATVAVGVIAVLGMWANRRYQGLFVSPKPPSDSPQLALQDDTLRTQLLALRQTMERQGAALDRMKRERSGSEELILKLQQQLNASRADVDRLSGQLGEADAKSMALENAQQQKDAVVADLRSANEKLHREKADELASRLILEAQVRDLTESLQQQSASLEREHQLMAVSQDVRQLMGARNLHIIDVHDVDGGGKAAKAFGRVFYAEGQSLIFYAFDLPNGRLMPAKYTFQAWGQKEYVSHSVRNLGTFAVDDHDQRRWVLKVTDPALLKGIDSVFVTAEGLGDVKEPRGRKLLYAYVVGQANHP